MYAYGEVKSALEDKHLDEFISHSKHVRSKLRREDVPNGYIEEMREEDDGSLVWQPWPERGHLYRFLFGISSVDFDIDKALKKLCDTDSYHAPNLICLLDRGVIMAARAVRPNGEVTETYTHPQKARPPAGPDDLDGWTFSTPNSDYPEGATIFYAFTHLLEHLKNNVLLKTNYIEYMNQIVTLNTIFVHRK